MFVNLFFWVVPRQCYIGSAFASFFLQNVQQCFTDAGRALRIPTCGNDTGGAIHEIDSQSLPRSVFLHDTRDLRKWRAKCANVGPKLFVIFGGLFAHNSSFVNSFWLTLFVVRVLYHRQGWETTRHPRKYIRKKYRLAQGRAHGRS